MASRVVGQRDAKVSGHRSGLRAKPDAHTVSWVEGTAASLRDGVFDLALHPAPRMRSLARKGRGRSTCGQAGIPERAWEHWNLEESRSMVVLADRTEVEVVTEVTAVDDNVVSFATHYRFDDGTSLTSTADLRFRTIEELRVSLPEAGFSIGTVYGGWERQPVGAPDGELLVIATR